MNKRKGNSIKDKITTHNNFSALSNLITTQQKITEWLKPLQEVITKITKFWEETFAPINESLKELKPIFAKLSRQIETANKIKENQFVWWQFLNDDIVEYFNENNDNKIATYLANFYINDNRKETNLIIGEIQNHKIITSEFKELFFQSIECYNKKLFEVCINSLLIMADGLLSIISGNITTNIKKRSDEILGKIGHDNSIDSDDFSVLMLYMSFIDFVDTLNETSDFTETDNEPNKLNRHWILHGRSRKLHTEVDCIRMLTFICGMLKIYDLNKGVIKNEKTKQ